MLGVRETNPPDGQEQLPPLKKEEIEALTKQTNQAINGYACFLTEREAAALLADLEATPAKRPLLQQRFQENEIIRIIKELGYTPRSLPKYKPGKNGVKAEVRAQLAFSPSTFNKAWERLSIEQAIQYAEQ